MANIIILRKLVKKNYLKTKIYYLITLLNILGKALEIIIGRKLNKIAKGYKI